MTSIESHARHCPAMEENSCLSTLSRCSSGTEGDIGGETMTHEASESLLQAGFAEKTAAEMAQLTAYWKDPLTTPEPVLNSLVIDEDSSLSVDPDAVVRNLYETIEMAQHSSQCFSEHKSESAEEPSDMTITTADSSIVPSGQRGPKALHFMCVQQTRQVDAICEAEKAKSSNPFAGLADQQCSPLPPSPVHQVRMTFFNDLQLSIAWSLRRLHDHLWCFIGEIIPMEWLPIWFWACSHPKIVLILVIACFPVGWKVSFMIYSHCFSFLLMRWYDGSVNGASHVAARDEGQTTLSSKCWESQLGDESLGFLN